MISERQKEILDRIIWEYTNTAQPVSSQILEKRYDFDICPATIRIEMQRLTDGGYLCQPHTSAGRIPTDKGYRLFVNNLLEKGIKDYDSISEIEKILKDETEDIIRFTSRLTKFLAAASSEFVMAYLAEKDFFWKEGWEEILLKPEFNERNIIHSFTDLLENFEGKIEDLGANSEIKIFIGKENPFSKARDFSIISSKCCLPNAKEAMFTLLGPKRMDYNRNISLVNSLTRLLEEF